MCLCLFYIQVQGIPTCEKWPKECEKNVAFMAKFHIHNWKTLPSYQEPTGASLNFWRLKFSPSSRCPSMTGPTIVTALRAAELEKTSAKPGLILRESAHHTHHSETSHTDFSSATMLTLAAFTASLSWLWCARIWRTTTKFRMAPTEWDINVSASFPISCNVVRSLATLPKNCRKKVMSESCPVWPLCQLRKIWGILEMAVMAVGEAPKEVNKRWHSCPSKRMAALMHIHSPKNAHLTFRLLPR